MAVIWNTNINDDGYRRNSHMQTNEQRIEMLLQRVEWLNSQIAKVRQEAKQLAQNADLQTVLERSIVSEQAKRHCEDIGRGER